MEDLLPKNSKPFDAKKARSQMGKKTEKQSEITHFLTSEAVRKNERENKGFHPDEWFLKNSEEIVHHQGQEVVDETVREYSTHTCIVSGEPILISTQRTLGSSNKEVTNRICTGHKKVIIVRAKESFKASVAHVMKKLKKDPTIKSFHIKCLSPGFSEYICEVTWKHKDNTENCDAARTIISEETSSLNQDWIYEDVSLWELSKSHNATIIENNCLERTPKGQCIRESISFLYQEQNREETHCHYLKKSQCEQVEKKCVKDGFFGCEQWELTFRCCDRVIRYSDIDDLYKLDDQEVHQEPNHSFADVVTKLSIFKEAKKQLEDSQSENAVGLEIFGGKKQLCSKNVADGLLYDCCFSHSGLAKRIGLAKCNSDEISLAEKRELGLCHYVGSLDKKTLGIKTSTEHVFCCFPSKLARIVHEQGRKQLHIGWGDGEEPHCSGLTFEQLGKIDFSKMDLSELCEEIPKQLSEDFNEKIDAFQNRLKEELNHNKEGNV